MDGAVVSSNKDVERKRTLLMRIEDTFSLLPGANGTECSAGGKEVVLWADSIRKSHDGQRILFDDLTFTVRYWCKLVDRSPHLFSAKRSFSLLGPLNRHMFPTKRRSLGGILIVL